MAEDRRLAEKREYQAVDCTPEMGGVADVVHVPPGHVPAVKQVQGSEDIPRDGDGYHEYVDSHLRLEEDGCEKDC